MDKIFEIASYHSMSIRQAAAAEWTALAIECAPCGTTTHISLHRLIRRSRYGFFEEIVTRMRCHECGGEPSAAYIVREVRRRDPLKDMSHHVEEWSSSGAQFYETLAACQSVSAAHAAYDVELEAKPSRTLLLRQGAHVIRSNIPDPNPPGNVVPLDTSSLRPEIVRLLAWKKRAG